MPTSLNSMEMNAIKEDWDLPELRITRRSWKELNQWEKARRIGQSVLNLIGVLACLYFFICSLDFMSSAFRLLGAKTAGKAFADSKFLNNPITALMLGVLVAALLHSSSMVVSVIIAMVASRIITVRQAIPIIMGADIGTAITNILVSIIGGKGGGGANSERRDQFKRAFAAATVHDMFNWLSVVVFLPLEIMTGFLYHLSNYAVSKLNIEQANYKQKQMLKRITKPFTALFIELDEKSLDSIAKNLPGSLDLTILKRYCGRSQAISSIATTPAAAISNVNETSLTPLLDPLGHPINEGLSPNWLNANARCDFVLARTDWSDNVVGCVMLAVSLCMLAICLIGMVKILQSILKTKISLTIRRIINYKFPGRFACLTGYFAILFGAFVTFMIQSSTIFTSTLTPLVGVGLVALENVYPLTLGSNIGTTTTGLLASLTVSGTDVVIYPPTNFTINATMGLFHDNLINTSYDGNLTQPTVIRYNSLRASLQIALIHTFYNILGVALFYPIPFMRLPLIVAKFLGEICYRYRWFSVAYLAIFYFFFPFIIFGLSALGGFQLLLWAFLVPLATILTTAIVVSRLQERRPKMLPPFLRTWMFLPECLRSLRPIDRFLTRIFRIFCSGKKRRRPNPKGGNLEDKNDYIGDNSETATGPSRRFWQKFGLSNHSSDNLGKKKFDHHKSSNGVKYSLSFTAKLLMPSKSTSLTSTMLLSDQSHQPSLTNLTEAEIRQLRQSPPTSFKFNPKASIADSGINVAESNVPDSFSFKSTSSSDNDASPKHSNNNSANTPRQKSPQSEGNNFQTQKPTAGNVISFSTSGKVTGPTSGVKTIQLKQIGPNNYSNM